MPEPMTRTRTDMIVVKRPREGMRPGEEERGVGALVVSAGAVMSEAPDSKTEIPNPKSQIPKKLQIPISNGTALAPTNAHHIAHALELDWNLMFGIFLEFGVWDLEFLIIFLLETQSGQPIPVSSSPFR